MKCVSYLSGSTEGEVFPTEVSDDSCRQSVPQDIDHGPKPVAVEMGRAGKPHEVLHNGEDQTVSILQQTTLQTLRREAFLHNENYYLQYPVDGHYECDVIWRQAH